MTHGKANNHSHRIPQQFGALLQQRPVVEGSAYDNFATAGKKIQPPGAKPQPLVNLQKTRSTSLTVSKQPLREDTSPRYARSLQAQSTVLRGGVIACANHRQGGRFRQIEARANLRVKKSGLWTGEHPFAISQGSPSLARQNSSWSNAPAATPAPLGAGCPAKAARRHLRSMPCVRTSSLELNNRMVSRHRFDGSAKPVIRGRTGLVAAGPVYSLTSDRRPSSDRSLLCARPFAIEHTGGHRHASNSCHAVAWHHHLLSDRSGALSPPYADAINVGGVRGRGFRKGADGGSPAVSVQSRAKATRGKAGTAVVTGHVRRSTAGTGLRVGEAIAVWPATSEFMDVTGRRDARLFHTSGDGLGIQQPGSMTWGTKAKVQTPSGRADDSAMCPAVARNDRRVA